MFCQWCNGSFIKCSHENWHILVTVPGMQHLSSLLSSSQLSSGSRLAWQRLSTSSISWSSFQLTSLPENSNFSRSKSNEKRRNINILLLRRLILIFFKRFTGSWKLYTYFQFWTIVNAFGPLSSSFSRNVYASTLVAWLSQRNHVQFILQIA